MKTSRIVLACIVSVLALVVLSGCGKRSNTDTVMRQQTAAAMKEANAQIGMPAIVNFQERKLAKMVFEMRDKADLVCYAYLLNSMTGKPVFLGKCIGYGLPYSVQYTNPERVILGSDYPSGLADSGKGTIPQADPNGLFMPTGLSATWLMLVDPQTGEAKPAYVEPEIIVSPFPLPRL